ncbi:MAG: proton-conducting transporter membrane subunit [Nitrospiraceae bacterium]
MTAGGLLLAALACLPLAGAVLGLAVWSSPRRLKAWALLVSLASLGVAAALNAQAGSAAGILPVLLPLAAFLSLLGQPPHDENRAAWIVTLLLLGLGLGIATAGAGLGLILLALVLILLCVVIHRYRGMSVYHPWQGIGTYAVGVVCIVAALVAPDKVSSLAYAAVFAMLLPLVPLHGGYVASLAGLPGNLPAFLAVLLPTLGFHGMLALSSGTQDVAGTALAALGLAGAAYGAVKALAQSRARSVLAYANLSFFSILWWYVATAGSVPAAATVYVAGVGLATSGLLLAWYAIRARYGDMDLRAIHGLAQPMPRFALLFALLALAALGLPPFGVFSGFLGMFLRPSLELSGWFAVIVLAWFAASWYFVDLVQRLIFGRHRPDLPYRDLRWSEMAPLLVILLVLAVLGVVPAQVFGPATHVLQVRATMEGIAWIP